MGCSVLLRAIMYRIAGGLIELSLSLSSSDTVFGTETDLFTRWKQSWTTNGKAPSKGLLNCCHLLSFYERRV